MAELVRGLQPSAQAISEQSIMLRAEALKSAQQGLAAWWYDHPDVPRCELVKTIVAMSGIDDDRRIRR